MSTLDCSCNISTTTTHNNNNFGKIDSDDSRMSNRKPSIDDDETTTATMTQTNTTTSMPIAATATATSRSGNHNNDYDHHVALKEFYKQHANVILSNNNNNNNRGNNDNFFGTTTTEGTNSRIVMKHRFVRFNPRFSHKTTYAKLQQEINAWMMTYRTTVNMSANKHSNNDINGITTDDDDNNDDKVEDVVVDSDNNNNGTDYDYRCNEYPMIVPWLRSSDSNTVFNFYAIPYPFPLQQLSKCWKDGLIYGQDVSSGAAVAVLLTNDYDDANTNTTTVTTNNNPPKQGHQLQNNTSDCCLNGSSTSLLSSFGKDSNDGNDAKGSEATTTTATQFRVLDLCCSPGLKLCAIADYFYHQNRDTKNGTTTTTSKENHNFETNVNSGVAINNACSTDAAASSSFGCKNDNNNKVVVVGVDISSHRMDLCKRIVHKYQISTLSNSDSNNDIHKNVDNESTTGDDNGNENYNQKRQPKQDTTNRDDDNTGSIQKRKQGPTQHYSNNDNTDVQIRLYCNDGTSFGTNVNEMNLVFDSNSALEEEISRRSSSCSANDSDNISKKRKRMNKSARAREKKRLQNLKNADIAINNNSISTTKAIDDTMCLVSDYLTTTERIANNGINDICEHYVDKNPNGNNFCIQLFDRVLVDAECSTDGSLKHLQKRIVKKKIETKSRISIDDDNNDNNVGVRECHSTSTDDVDENSDLITIKQLTDPKELSDLVQLQKKLISSGFNLLKVGGYMVYSTCSLSEDQNENVVQWLLEQNPTSSKIVPIKFEQKFESSFDDIKNRDPDYDCINNQRQSESSRDVEKFKGTSSHESNNFIREGTLPGTVRFLPHVSFTDDDDNFNNGNSNNNTSSSLLDGYNSRSRCTQDQLYGGGFFLAKIMKV